MIHVFFFFLLLLLFLSDSVFFLFSILFNVQFCWNILSKDIFFLIKMELKEWRCIKHACHFQLERRKEQKERRIKINCTAVALYVIYEKSLISVLRDDFEFDETLSTGKRVSHSLFPYQPWPGSLVSWLWEIRCLGFWPNKDYRKSQMNSF